MQFLGATYESQKFSRKKCNHQKGRRQDREKQRKEVEGQSEGEKKREGGRRGRGKKRRKHDFAVSREMGVIALWNHNSIDWTERVFGTMWDDLNRCACSLAKTFISAMERRQVDNDTSAQFWQNRIHFKQGSQFSYFYKGKRAPSAPWSVWVWEFLSQHSFFDSSGFFMFSKGHLSGAQLINGLSFISCHQS